MMVTTAWKGVLELKLARWDTKAGHTVQFMIPEQPVDSDHANPFKKFTKMRGDRVGTRFEMIAAEFIDGQEPALVFRDEVMLKGWTDSNSGWTVTFWLPPPDQDHQFEPYSVGQTFVVALMEIMDDQEPVDQVKRDLLSGKKKMKTQKLTQAVAMMCNDEVFWHWVNLHTDYSTVIECTEHAAEYVRHACDVESRAEFNTDEAAAQRFHRIVRRPYAAYREEMQA